ncbi:hypothetical protein [Streptomonospora sediminis]
MAGAALLLAGTAPVANAQAGAEPRRVVVGLEVVGGSGVLFDGYVLTAGRQITTPSGGTHVCDGTNNDANPHASGTPTTALDDASDRAGFTWDGEWYEEFGDFLITRIGGDRQSDSVFWQISVNGEQIGVGAVRA